VSIGHGLRMALLPEGRQNYVVGQGDLTRSIELARGHAGGDSLRVGSVSFGTTTVARGVVCTGAFRTAAAPARVVVQVGDGTPHEAELLTLRGDPGWGAYHAFLDDVPQDATITVTALAADGPRAVRHPGVQCLCFAVVSASMPVSSADSSHRRAACSGSVA
jgi:hypothetical protein